jgi:hypothetical protein
MRALAIVLGIVFVGPAAADNKPTPAQPKAAEVCPKKIFVGKGLERKAVCVVETPLVVKAAPPKPQVTIVPNDGRAVTGRPKNDDRLRGLGPHTR